MCYRENLLNASKNNKLKYNVPKYITVEDMERAARETLKHVQRGAFPEGLNHPEKSVKKRSRLHKLDPIIIDELLNVFTLGVEESDYSPKGRSHYQIKIDNYHRICGHFRQRTRPGLN